MSTRVFQSVINQLIQWVYELNYPNAEVPVFEMYEPEDVDLTLAQRDKILFVSLDLRSGFRVQITD